MATSDRACLRAVDLIANALRGRDEIIAVTGATGWFGGVTLDLLYEALGPEAGSRVVAYGTSARKVAVSDGRIVSVKPLPDIAFQDPPPTTLLHFAFLARDKLPALGVDSYVRQNIAITAVVAAAIAKHTPRHLVVLSSGAVYSSTGGLVFDVRADPYAALKHLDELVFRAASDEAGSVCVIPRVFSVAGARMTRPDLYALGSLIGMATLGGPIEVQARGPVFRSYCGVDEVVALSLWAALSGRTAVFDTCGTVVEIGDLARLVAQVHGLDGHLVRRTRDPDLSADWYVGDGRHMENLATEAGLSLERLPALVRETSAWLTAARVRRSA